MPATRVFFSAGEASGDSYAAALIREIRKLRQTGIEFEGIGGARSKAEGMAIHADSSSWGAIGVAQALKCYPRVFSGYYRAKAKLGAATPGLFIPIDFGYVNIRLARHAKNRGWRVLYFIPPGSWRRDRQGKDLPSITDRVVTPFPWSAEILTGIGANAFWFGHPIKQLVAERSALTGSEPAEKSWLAILPGSRSHEIDANLPLLAKAVKGLEAPIIFALAPALNAQNVMTRWKALTGREDGFKVGDTVGVCLGARAALVCSGTATLEAALCQCPMVAFYQLTSAMVLEASLLRIKRPKFIALPNILLDRLAVPELIKREGIAPEALRAELDDIWSDSPKRADQMDAFEELDSLLGPADAITKTAELAVELLDERPI